MAQPALEGISLTGRRSTLLICADDDRSHAIIRALESEHDIWHVARQRDAMAWLTCHRPQTVVLDLDMDGIDAAVLLDCIRSGDHGSPSMVIGLCKDPSRLPPSLTIRLDQLI